MLKLKRFRAALMFLLFVASPALLRAQTLTVIHAFDGDGGNFPVTPVLQASNGRLYGSTYGGIGRPTIFALALTGEFEWKSGCVGLDTCPAQINDGFIQATNGVFYATTGVGGPYENGTIFEMNAAGKTKVLYSFCEQSGCPDGFEPIAGFVQGIDGSLYGATSRGGDNGDCQTIGGCGTIFRFSLDGKFTVLHTFDGADGAGPSAPLIQASDGNFYGAARWGGANSSCAFGTGCGVIFRITPGGTYSTVYNFCSQPNCADGEDPMSALVQGADGNFYGATYGGGMETCEDNGSPQGCGTIFKVTPAGVLTTLHAFCSSAGCQDGANPEGALVQGTDGNFYGATNEGGNHGCFDNSGCGTIFSITPTGQLTTLYTLCSKGGSSCTDGATPYSGLIQDTNGLFYGTTSAGGLNRPSGDGKIRREFSTEPCCGTVFSLDIGLGPFVSTNPAAAAIGARIGILGTDLTGASGVTFNGVSASFTVKSATLIIATVPSGATTGKIQVVTPNGTLNSNVPFIVLK